MGCLRLRCQVRRRVLRRRNDYTGRVNPFLRLASCFLCTAAFASAALDIMPLSQVRAGQRGVGRTVFSGDNVEEFQVEILGVLSNTGPKEALILGRLSGWQLEHTGVMQGMSGSPVYIGGKLIGAVAMAFPYAKDPIAGIRPIEEMLRVDAMPGWRTEAPAIALYKKGTGLGLEMGAGALLPVPARRENVESRLTEVATPMSFSGFTSSAIESFGPAMRGLGLEPRQGLSLGGAPDMRMGDPKKLRPGSMISVQLMTGDMSVGADGTVTAIDGDRVYAFGHRFLSLGPTELPFTRAEVITLLANVNTSFKISTARELMGIISQDRNTGVAGTVGRRAAMLPLDISVVEETKPAGEYHMQMVRDRYLSPYLLQMALFSAIDATQRATGASSVTVKGSIQFEGRQETALVNSIYAADGGSNMMAATTTAVSLSYLMQGGFDSLKVARIAFRLETSNAKQGMNVGQVYLSRKEAKAGETVEVMAVLDGENGRQLTRSVQYTIPLGTAAGTLQFTVADGSQTSVADLRQVLSVMPRTPEQMISNVNRLRSADAAYLRVWRAEAAYEVQGEELPDPPPSVAMVLSGAPGIPKFLNSKLAEIRIDADGNMVTGAKTVQLEVKE